VAHRRVVETELVPGEAVAKATEDAAKGSGTRLGLVDAPTFENHVLEGNPPDVKEIGRRVRALVLERMPDAVEWIDTGNGLAAYGTERKMSAVAFAIIPHKAHVNLQFADGADLEDPDGLVEGTGKRIRHVKFRSVEDVERPAARRLVDQQVARRTKPGG
jgi:hypothetical protein